MSKEKLDRFIEANGLKHWSFAARKDKDFVDWVNTHTSDYPEDSTFAERVYGATSGSHIVCENGNKRKFNTILTGWRFCGPAGKCACASKSVSEKCKAAFANKTDQDYADRETKTRATNLERYGVTNGGLTEKAINARDGFYGDPTKVAELVASTKKTMLERHGVENAFQIQHVRDASKKALQSETSRDKKRRKHQTKFENGVFIQASYDKLKTKFETFGLIWEYPKESYVGIYGTTGRDKYPFYCVTCETKFDDYIYDGHIPRCPFCDPPKYKPSAEETSVADFIASFGFDVHRGRWDIVPNRNEIDIYLPEKNIAIEYGGLFYHSENSSTLLREFRPKGRIKDKNYHAFKTQECGKKGIRLITIFSDEWLMKTNICKTILASVLGKVSPIAVSDATVERITHFDAEEFFGQHHLRGYGKPSENRYGLFHGGEMVAAMTFGSMHKSDGRSVDGCFELHRFASAVAITGGADKLFRRFVSDFDPRRIEANSDLRWGIEDFYYDLGFSVDGIWEPIYWYVGDGYTKRYDVATTKTMNRGKTEEQIVAENGFDIIWDCGNAKLVWEA